MTLLINCRWLLQRLGSGSKVLSIDKDARTVSLADGSQLHYESLLTTMPLDLTLQWLGKPDWADELTHRWAVLTCGTQASS